MKWEDTSPAWQPQDMARLQQIFSDRQILSERNPIANSLDYHSLINRASVCVLVESSVLEAIHNHLGQTLHEQGGLLIGEVFGGGEESGQRKIASVRVIMITEAIASTDFDASAISLRMQSGIWTEARSRLGEQRLIVGWYHSHPDLGAFFSSTDRRTQAAFFPHPYSLGWVIDPIRSEQAWYLGAHSEAIKPSQFSVLPE